MKIINNFSRGSLNEGRSFGFGFGFAKKQNNETFISVMPISPCKDYLNDTLYAEKTGDILNFIYGFKYSQINNLFNEPYLYLLIKVYGDPKGEKHLQEHYQDLQFLINTLEDKLGLDQKTKITLVEKYYLITVPLFWGSKVYLISLYTLLLRAFQTYEKQFEPDILTLIKEQKFHSGDTGNIMSCTKQIEYFMNIYPNILEQEFTPIEQIFKHQEVHNSWGFINYFKEK